MRAAAVARHWEPPALSAKMKEEVRAGNWERTAVMSRVAGSVMVGWVRG